MTKIIHTVHAKSSQTGEPFHFHILRTDAGDLAFGIPGDLPAHLQEEVNAACDRWQQETFQ